jgi:hypothetical protein
MNIMRCKRTVKDEIKKINKITKPMFCLLRGSNSLESRNCGSGRRVAVQYYGPMEMLQRRDRRPAEFIFLDRAEGC